MTPNNTPHRSRRLFGATAVALAGATFAVGGAAAAADSTTVSLDPQVAETVSTDEMTFPIPYQMGQAADSTMTVDMLLDAGTGSIDLGIVMGINSEVVEATPDGAATTRATMNSIDVVRAPEGMPTDEFDALVGIIVDQPIAADGTPGEIAVVNEAQLAPQQIELAREYFSQQESFSVHAPDGPVSVGDTWTADEVIVSNGLELPVSYQYELTALDAENYTITVTVDAPVETEIEGEQLSGNITLDGTITGDRDNPLLVNGSLVMSTNVGSDQFSVSIDATIGIESVEVAPTGTATPAPGSTSSQPPMPPSPTAPSTTVG